MKLTKEDYMRLPKERLAELLAEMDENSAQPIVIPTTHNPEPCVAPNDAPYTAPGTSPFWPIVTCSANNKEGEE